MPVERTTVNGLPAVRLTHPSGASALVYVYGAHLASWKTAGAQPGTAGPEQLFVSSKTAYGGGKAIRGGVPVCWPQFNNLGAQPKHGFARNSAEWTVVRTSDDPFPSVVLGLADSEATRASYPSAFRLRYSVSLESDMSVSTSLSVMNAGNEPLEFTTALHTYFAVDAVGAAEVRGLEGLTYDDSVAARTGLVEAEGAVSFGGEVDRIYYGAPAEMYVVGTPTDRGGGRAVRVLKMGFADAVAWNIGEARAGGLADLGPGEWAKYVCLEAALIGRPAQLAPNCSWAAGQTFTSIAAEEAKGKAKQPAALD